MRKAPNKYSFQHLKIKEFTFWVPSQYSKSLE